MATIGVGSSGPSGAPGFLTAADVVARDAIPSHRRTLGMQVWVYGGQRLYQLRGGLTNADWVEVGPEVGSLYVDAVAGNDANQGLVSSPIQTLEEAARRSGSLGRTAVVYFAPGTYDIPPPTDIGDGIYDYSAATFVAQDNLILLGSRDVLTSFTLDHVTDNVLYATGSPGWVVDAYKGKYVEYVWPGWPGWYISGWVLSNTADTVTVAISMDSMSLGEMTAPVPGDTIEIQDHVTHFTGSSGIYARGPVQAWYVDFAGGGALGTALGATSLGDSTTSFGCRFYGWGGGVFGRGSVANCMFDHVSYALWTLGQFQANGDNVYLDGDVIARVTNGELILNHGCFHWQERTANGVLVDVNGAVDDGTQGFWVGAGCGTYVRLDGCCQYRQQYHPMQGLAGHATFPIVFHLNGPNCHVELIDSNLSTLIGTSYFRIGNTGARTISLAEYVAAGRAMDCGDGSYIVDKNAAGAAELLSLRARRFAEAVAFDDPVTLNDDVTVTHKIVVPTPAGADEAATRQFVLDEASPVTTLADVPTRDHDLLQGLGDDDHGQYHNDTRGDLRYYTKAQIDALIAAMSPPAVWDSLVIVVRHFVDATAGDTTVTLPAASASVNVMHVVKKLDASDHLVTVACTGSDTVEDETTLVLEHQGDAASLLTNGTNWEVV
jgi:hypothetical protein